ncbi:PAS domain S-box-containing protein/diguanylate cyclase (GGDEF)-like protein [Tumebacillus sp. BK434]|uniref:EAL domain-containing protein n=1 Tax=Tumebacillus sp. BK434 TaxID=2512169 RepID=UPI0010EF1FC3|nr:EAL domain-containing protein [Tumebacillus sp. BK434]TCP55838.1 PAS domain S-box-containing protein/diguanylate cyclase (GGDEF)-like protein [Tumebacillus sp. BK434]
MHVIWGEYHTATVALSILIAVLASYTAINLGSRVTEAKGMARRLWQVGGATALGLGIWSMHFVAMLAFELEVQVTYRLWLVILSVLPAVVASGLALYLVSRPRLQLKELLFGSLLMGAGISAMHYTGMYAMQMQAHMVFDPLLVAASVLVAVGASFAALSIIYRLRVEGNSRSGAWRKLFSALLMGGAISGMHYTGMAAVMFTHSNEQALEVETALDNLLLAYTIGGVTLLLLGVVIVTAVVERRVVSNQNRLDDSERRYKSLFDHNPEAIFTVDVSGAFIEVNPKAEQLLGYSSKQLLQMNVLTFVVPEDVAKIERLYPRVLAREPQQAEISILHKAGHRVEMMVILVPIVTEERVSGVYVIAQDITEKKQAERAISSMAYHDDLTGMPNRRMAFDVLNRAIQEAQDQEYYVAIMLLDLDRFKTYNDSLGHIFGDKMIKALGERLTAAFGGDVVAARLGGDEYTLIFPRLDTINDVETRAQELCSLIEQPLLLLGHEVRLTASVGVALYPCEAQDAVSMLRNADTAMYRAKEHGNSFCLYDPSMDTKAYERMLLETDLRKALERDEFVLWYQPQINLETMRIEGVEALVRWQHPELGLVPPFRFIPLAEETGLIVPLGEWVLRTACQTNKRWQELGLPKLRMGVNLSMRQFRREDLFDTVAGVLAETGLDPADLELEITESMTMDLEQSLQTLEKLKSLGVQIGIDDFGTGYSSLSYLKKFPIDRLKIDRSFVSDIETDENDRSIVTTILLMAHNLRLKVTAEGVETEAQQDFLKAHGCDDAQGYLYSRPVPQDEIQQLFLQTPQS